MRAEVSQVAETLMGRHCAGQDFAEHARTERQLGPALLNRQEQTGHLGGQGAEVAVEKDEDIAGCGAGAGRAGVTVATPRFNDNVGAGFSSEGTGAIGGTVIHDDDARNRLRSCLAHELRDVAGFVQGWDDDVDVHGVVRKRLEAGARSGCAASSAERRFRSAALSTSYHSGSRSTRILSSAAMANVSLRTVGVDICTSVTRRPGGFLTPIR